MVGLQPTYKGLKHGGGGGGSSAEGGFVANL